MSEWLKVPVLKVRHKIFSDCIIKKTYLVYFRVFLLKKISDKYFGKKKVQNILYQVHSIDLALCFFTSSGCKAPIGSSHLSLVCNQKCPVPLRK